ncbi:MAG: S8 family serine peptidase, partial [Proteobacteria bacterium]|nr:S8 family serine peptidase [Pseudomonadota bacterium]
MGKNRDPKRLLDTVSTVIGPSCDGMWPRGILFLIFVLLAGGIVGCHKIDTRSLSKEIMQSGSGAEYFAHEVIVKRAPTTNDEAFARAIGEVGGEITEADSLMTTKLGYYRILLPDDVIADEAISILQKMGAIETAERNYVVRAVAEPNDPMMYRLWGMEKANAVDAWDIATGSKEVVVAVSDTGVDYTHEDLAVNIWTNTDEIPNNGVDDDGNGFIDDYRGWDWYNNDNDPMDDSGHGSHCAGTIGAAGNNGIGVVGVNWNVSIMPLKFMSSSGRGSTFHGAQTILYAAQQEVDIVSASWGCLGCDSSSTQAAIQVLAEAGGLFVAAAGNDGEDIEKAEHYPAGLPNDNIVAVAASNSLDNLAYFSNFSGTKVHLAAPGRNVLSTYRGGTYVSLEGTSMAAPHVAGAAALYLSVREDVPYSHLKKRLMGTCDKTEGLTGKVISKGRLNVYRMLTDDEIPPSRPEGLLAVGGLKSDVTLYWNPNTEQDMAQYLVEWGTISGGPYPQSMIVSAKEASARVYDLENDVRHYFVVSAVDESANSSEPSIEVSAVPQDRTAPPKTIDLRAGPFKGEVAWADVIGASSENTEHYKASNVADGNPDTAWVTLPQATPVEESLILELYEPFSINRVVLTPSGAYPEFFPVDFDIDVSMNGTAWEIVGGRRNVSILQDETIEVTFPAVEAAYIRLKVLTPYEHPSGYYYTGLSEITVYRESLNIDTIQLQFTAPGDDPGEGHSESYEIRYSESPIDEESFVDAVLIEGPIPAPSGVLEIVDVPNLEPEITYYFALFSFDEAGNKSPLSNIASSSTLVIPPSTVNDLDVVDTTAGAITLGWTAPGGDGFEGTAANYELRYSKSPINAANFKTCSLFIGMPAPSESGTSESITVSSLDVGERYYFALIAHDDKGASSGVSNIVSAVAEGGSDTTPPANIDDLTGLPALVEQKLEGVISDYSTQRSKGSPIRYVHDGGLYSWWRSVQAPGNVPEWFTLDFGALTPITRFRMHAPNHGSYTEFYPQDFDIGVGIDGEHFSPAVKIEGLLGKTDEWDDWSVPPIFGRYAQVYVHRRGPASCYWSLSGYHCDAPAWVAIAEFEAYAASPDFNIDLSWVAPGDDEWFGRVSSYDLRHSTNPISSENFDEANPIITEEPNQGGMLELLLVSSLEYETTHYFALKAIDESGNKTEMSNLVSVVAPPMPPAPVTDLTAVSADIDSITLEWTATGDDGMYGIATFYDMRYYTEPITLQNWDDAQVLLNTPTPSPSGSVETYTADNLDSNVQYFFALKVMDELSADSLISNVASLDTLDGIPPGVIQNLVVTPIDPHETSEPLPLGILQDSWPYSDEYKSENLIDGDEVSSWMSNGYSEDYALVLRFGLAQETNVSRIRIRPSSEFADLFPVDFSIYTQGEADQSWRIAAAEEDFVADDNWEEWTLGSVSANEVIIYINKTNQWNGLHIAAIAEIEVYGESTDYTSLRLSWTAPGGDGNAATAAEYDVRQSFDVIASVSEFEGAAQIDGAPTPSSAGSLERLDVHRLVSETEYCFAIVTNDTAGNFSDVSNSPCVTTPGEPPTTINDLARYSNGSRTATLTWTAPNDSSDGKASTYELRYSTGHINRDNWSSANLASDMLIPKVAGEDETYVLDGLEPVTNYYIAIRSLDSHGNLSNISNSVIIKTMDGTPPSPIDDLEASTNESGHGLLNLNWTAPGDDGTQGRAAYYYLRYSKSPITEENFYFATSYSVPKPLDSGSYEVAEISGLEPETRYYLAIRASDEAGNRAPISNLASAVTRSQSPYPIDDLVASNLGFDSVSLTWTATGDNGISGTATAYILRYFNEPLTEENWSAATTVANQPTPSPSGSIENTSITGLNSNTLYYFALKAIDDLGNESGISNIANGETLDNVPPAGITDLNVMPKDSVDVPPLLLEIGDSSGSYSSIHGPEKTLDGNVDTAWFSHARENLETEFIQFDLLEQKRLGRLRLRAAQRYTDLFPVDFLVEVKEEGSDVWETVVSETDFTTDGEWEEWALGAIPAAHVRLVITKTVLWAGSYYTSLSGFEVYEDPAMTSSLRLSWTATGEDGNEGTCSSYDIGVSDTMIIDDNLFEASTQLDNPPNPMPAGSLERLELDGLDYDTTYCFAIKAEDPSGNASPLSNSPCATTPGLPPKTITDLEVADFNAASITLNWTAPEDDAGETHEYILKKSLERITINNWDEAEVIEDIPNPKSQGEEETYVVSGLDGATKYYFALRSKDSAGNMSGLSNNAAATTTDNVPPSRVDDLFAETNSSIKGSIILAWTAPGDNGIVGRAAEYDIRVSVDSIDESSFEEATRIDAPEPASYGEVESIIVRGLALEAAYNIALKAIDGDGNVSVLSNVATARTSDEAPGVVSDLRIIGSTGDTIDNATITLEWTATGDDGSDGTATSYDIRYSNSGITNGNFEQANPISNAPAPEPSGTVQQVTVFGLSPGKNYVFALVATDDRENSSSISNVVSGTTPDGVPPAEVVDISAVTGTMPASVKLTWTHTGDDGQEG